MTKEQIWRNETLMVLVYMGSRVLVAAAILTGVGALVLFGMRIYINSL